MFAVEYTQRDKVNSASIPYLVQYGNYPVPMASGEFTPGSNPLSQAALNNYFAPIWRACRQRFAIGIAGLQQ